VYNRHVAGTGYTTCGPGGIFGLARNSVGGDVVVNAGTTVPNFIDYLESRYRCEISCSTWNRQNN